MNNPKHAAHLPSRSIERRLAAILSADVQGYSRLMGADEEATLRTLTSHRKVIDTLIAQHRGRIVGTAGDGLLAEFASIVDAVQCAVVIQNKLQAANAILSPERQMEFRIGINLGDVLVEGKEIYGDGVNVAARLQSLADAGGIFIGGTVHEQVENKLALTYEDLGEQMAKNIAKLVRAWRVVMDETAAVLAEEAERSTFNVQGSKPRRVGTAHLRWVAVGFVLITGTLVAVRYLSLPTPSTQSPTPNTRPLTPYTQSALPLPDKPSIVVLPFANMSGDSTQEYFSDGITEVLTSDLSRISSLFVIARNTAFTYKGKAANVQDVGRELGVRYVLEGSVQRTDKEVRIVAQLIDTTTGGHLWSERYDRELKDIFALQDELVQKIVTTLKLQLTLREQGYLIRKTTDNVESYDAYLRGLESLNHTTQETNAQARQLFEQAIALDPQYAEAYTRLSRTFAAEWVYQWSQDPQTLERAFILAQQAVALDDSLPGAHEALAYAYLYKRQHEQALAAAKRAVSLAPNEAEGSGMLGLILNFAGRPEEAIELIEKAIRLNPRYLNYLSRLGMAYCLAGRYEEAIAALKTAVIRNPDHLPLHLHLAVSYSELGRDAKARAEVAELQRISPNFSLEGLRRVMPFKDPAALERYLAALRKAGLK